MLTASLYVISASPCFTLYAGGYVEFEPEASVRIGRVGKGLVPCYFETEPIIREERKERANFWPG